MKLLCKKNYHGCIKNHGPGLADDDGDELFLWYG